MEIILRNTGAPIYEQIVEQIRHAVVSGELRAGDALPSMRTLATELRVSVITTKRAYEELEREGVIESMVGRGSFVTGRDPGALREEGLAKARQSIEAAVTTANRYKIEREALHEMVDELFGGRSNE